MPPETPVTNLTSMQELASTRLENVQVDVPVVFDGIRTFFYRFYNDWHEENILLESSILKAMDIGKKNC